MAKTKHSKKTGQFISGKGVQGMSAVGQQRAQGAKLPGMKARRAHDLKTLKTMRSQGNKGARTMAKHLKSQRNYGITTLY